MGTHAAIFGYLEIAGTEREFKRVREINDWNRAILTHLGDQAFWSTADFRFHECGDSRDVADVRAAQMIAVSKWFIIRPAIADPHEEILDILSKLCWDWGYLVNRFIDRSLVGGPVSIEYDVRRQPTDNTAVGPVGSNYELELYER